MSKNETQVKPLPEKTNTQFAANNGKFRKACELAEIEPTARQASKYRRGMGKAFAASKKA